MNAYGDTESVNLSRRVCGGGESRLEINRGFADVTRLGPSDDVKYGPREHEPSVDEIVRHAEKILKGISMHYRNGREAKNGDKVIQLSESYKNSSDGTVTPVRVTAVGILYDAKPGNDYCNGTIASILGGPIQGACLCDCLHLDDLAEILAEKGWDKRPSGK